MIKRILSGALGLLLLGGALAARAEPLLTLTKPDLVGPETVVGWSYRLVNDTLYDLYFTRVYADGTLYGSDGTSALGTFSDVAAARDNTVVPATSDFSGILADFAIAQDVPVGVAAVEGYLYLSYELYDNGLNYQGYGTLRAQYQGQDALAKVSVEAPPTAALLPLGLGLLGWRRRSRRWSPRLAP